jgi:hypothetical protein
MTAMLSDPDAYRRAVREARYRVETKKFWAEAVASQLKGFRKAGIEWPPPWWQREHLDQRLEALGVKRWP